MTVENCDFDLQAIMEYIKPRDVKQGKDYETTLLGRLLSVSCLAPADGSTAEFFDRPTRLSQTEVDTTENMIYQACILLLLVISGQITVGPEGAWPT